MHRHRTGLIDARLAGLSRTIGGQELGRKMEFRNPLAIRDWADEFLRDDDQQVAVVAGDRSTLKQLAQQRDVADTRYFGETLGGLAVQQPGNHEALPAL